MNQATTMRKQRILIIEDDAAISEVLEFNLAREGYDVALQTDGVEGLREAKNDVPDLIILDLMLPSMDGVDVCRELRADKSTRDISVLMLTAKSEEIDEMVGFSVGTDDYVTKPFSVKVLLQRVRVLLERRGRPGGEQDVMEHHGIKLDRLAHAVTCNGSAVMLTPTEYRLLETLMRQPGRAFSRSDLLSSAIGDETIVLERTIDVHIRSLRQKLGERSRVVETVRGVGYRFARDLNGN
ncbi:Phosphate regulon transcriptional regulatory protein PhoB [Planctomycetes bacterium Pan216]|uniref:Phosphate regulon transcriptional regulatory protein PhoB n=1 Tax=Kolteria novifilia TaxID=2527975 RepID=A0A518BA28_9BACT|nr:Phosphate regulon transcriptional regulatory protein PhoB [Planctomycetes bacterium Pan216]